MKKIYVTLMLAMIAGIFGVQAQKTSERIIVKTTAGDVVGYLPERVEEIGFYNVEGEVKANIELIDVEEGDDPVITLNVTKTDACRAFRICVVPPSAKAYFDNDAVAVKYIEMYGSQLIFNDFSNGGTLSGFGTLSPGAEYLVATVGYDELGVACGIDTVSFTTTRPGVVGNPDIECTVESVSYDEATISFRPNSDVSFYYYCSFEKDSFMTYYEQFAAMFGFNSPEEMVQMWCGSELRGNKTNTWTGLNPGTDYEIYVAMKDLDGNWAGLISVPFTTESYGGSGEAKCSIRFGEFEYNSEAECYLQRVIVTANSETAFFRDILVATEMAEDILAEIGYNSYEEYLMDDPYDGMNPYWNLYFQDDEQWSVEPDTEYTMYALAQNKDGVWGPLVSETVRTGAAKSSAPAAANAIAPTRANIERSVTKGSINDIISLPKVKKIQLEKL